MPPPLLSVCTALRRAHTSNTCLCSKDFAFVPGRDRGRVGWPIGLGVGCSPYPVLPATLPQAAALPAVAPALAAARQQRNEPAQGQRAVRAAQRAETRAGAAWTWCSTAHVERAVRQRHEQRRLPGIGVSICASWERPRLRARHQGVQGAPAQVAQRGTMSMRSGEICAAADDTGGSNMLLDLRLDDG